MKRICDPFHSLRNRRATWISVDGEPILMLLDWPGVREAAQDWAQFSSDTPFTVPIPSEAHVRTVRQLPIETDPPSHTQIRAALEPWFRRPTQLPYRARLEALVTSQIMRSLEHGPCDLVREFALPLQSRALAILLNMPEDEAQIWMGWGLHVFHDGDGDGDGYGHGHGDAPATRGAQLEAYIEGQIARAKARPGEDFFSHLTRVRLDDRPLTDEDMAGVANLAFAGGRDTVIHTITTMLAWIAEHPDRLEEITATPRAVNLAVEEFIRVASPLAHIARTCPAATPVHGETAPAGGRVSLCWAAANTDPKVFDDPLTLNPGRAPNPHMAFGAGPHTCLGAPHARALLRALLNRLGADARAITVTDHAPSHHDLGGLTWRSGYDRLLGEIR